MKKKRTDAERRLRQCERLSRLLRVLRLILGPGRWDADALAKELECSPRTIHRDLQTLSMAGVPWYYDAATESYRVRPGFRFPSLDTESAKATTDRSNDELIAAARMTIESGESFLSSVRDFCRILERAKSAEE